MHTLLVGRLRRRKTAEIRAVIPREARYLEPFKASEILSVDSDEYQAVGMSNRSDLPICVRRGSTQRLETCSLVAVPGGRNFIVRKDRE